MKPNPRLGKGSKVRIKKTGETATMRYTLWCGDVVVLLDKAKVVKRYRRSEVELAGV